MWNPFGKSRRRRCHAAPESPPPQDAAADLWPLDDPVILLTPWDALTNRDLFEGVLVIGNTGSGKSSTTGRILLKAALLRRWGILVITAKPQDAAEILQLCQETGRLHDLRIIRPGGPHHFSLLQYEMSREGPGGGNTDRVSRQITESLREGQAKPVATDAGEHFNQLSQIMLCSTLDVIAQAGEPLNLDSVAAFLDTMPKSVAALEGDAWRSGYCHKVLAKAAANAVTPEDIRRNTIASNQFLVRVPHANARSLGDTLATLDVGLFHLTREPFRQLLDSPKGCSFTPDLLADGSVTVIDCPACEWGPVGGILTKALKRTHLDYIQRRPINGDATRPLMVFCDEYQEHATRTEGLYQNVARSQRAATVDLTQSVSNLEAVFGSEAHTNSLTNALTTHIVHCTSGKTADWVQNRIAQTWQQTESVSLPGWSNEHRQSPGFNLSQSIHPQLLASELTRLRTGGPANGLLVDAVVFKPGRRFIASGLPYVRVQFQQE